VSFLDRIARGAEFRATSGLSNPAYWLNDAFGLSTTYSGERVNVENALGLGLVFSAVEKVSEAVGSLPLKVFRIEDDDQRIEARTHRSWRLLHDKPNEVTTADRFWSTVTAQLLLWGNAYLYKERASFGGDVESLYLLEPANVELRWDGREKRFWLNGGEYKFSVDEVLHIPAFSLNGISGCSRISYCRQTFGTALARAKFEGGFYQRGARFPAWIQHPGRLGEAGTKRLAEDMGGWHGGVQNMHKIPVLEEGASLNSIGMPLEDMQFVQQQELSRTEIAVIFNLPPAYLGGSTGDSLTYATTESNEIQFAQMALMPMANTIAKALTADPAILPWNVMFAEFVFEGRLRADMKTRAEYWKTMKEVLRLDPEYIASRENIPREAIEPEPEPPPIVPAGEADGNGAVPPEMTQMQQALKNASS
jgi:HK97 family phage portal protein